MVGIPHPKMIENTVVINNIIYKLFPLIYCTTYATFVPNPVEINVCATIATVAITIDIFTAPITPLTIPSDSSLKFGRVSR